MLRAATIALYAAAWLLFALALLLYISLYPIELALDLVTGGEYSDP